MLVYNSEKKCFEFSNDFVDQFLEDKKSSHFNQTLLHLYVNTSVNIINQTFDRAKNCLGDLILILEKTYNSIKIDDDKKTLVEHKRDEFFEYVSWLTSLKNHINLNLIGRDILNLYKLYKGNLSILNPNSIQSGPITSEQQLEVHNFINDRLNEAISTIKESQLYKLADRNGLLYHKPEEIQRFLKDDNKNLHDENLSCKRLRLSSNEDKDRLLKKLKITSNKSLINI